jgi:malate synthase
MTAPSDGATEAQLRALEVFKDLIKDAEGRQEWIAAERGQKEQVFNAHRTEALADADYQALPEPVRTLLETLSDSELALLSDIDATFVSSGVTVPGVPMMAH